MSVRNAARRIQLLPRNWDGGLTHERRIPRQRLQERIYLQALARRTDEPTRLRRRHHPGSGRDPDRRRLSPRRCQPRQSCRLTRAARCCGRHPTLRRSQPQRFQGSLRKGQRPTSDSNGLLPAYLIDVILYLAVHGDHEWLSSASNLATAFSMSSNWLSASCADEHQTRDNYAEVGYALYSGGIPAFQGHPQSFLTDSQLTISNSRCIAHIRVTVYRNPR